MPTRTRTPLMISTAHTSQRADIHLSIDDLAIATGLGRATLARLVRAGLVDPVAPGSGVFTAATAARVRRMLRLRADLGVNLMGAAIILDLVERLDRMASRKESH
jgi:DNA-binding transcriptional MerR regulator